MHTLLFLDPGHFHAALALRAANPRVADEIVVYAPDGPDLRDFLALVERFNRRPEAPTRWRPTVVSDGDPLARLIGERRGDVVVLAGRNGGKARTIRRLHEAGFHVLADKPWLVEPNDLEDLRRSLDARPLVVEMMTGRHDVTARLMKRVVDTPGVFGSFFTGGPAIELESVHHLEKLVDGTPLRRPWWFFDVRVQGSGAVDIPTHLVDQTQWLVDGAGDAAGEAPRLLSARGWYTRVPSGAFRRITGEATFPAALAPFMDGDALGYLCNVEMSYRIAGVTARVGARWELSAPPDGGDTYRAVARGTRATVVLEQGPETGGRRRLFVEPRGEIEPALQALGAAVAGWQTELPGVGIEREDPGSIAIVIPPALSAGHEAHFALVLDELLQAIDDGGWPAAAVARTLAKYALLAEAAAAVSPAPD
jgi:predicted dehydrogenase